MSESVSTFPPKLYFQKYLNSSFRILSLTFFGPSTWRRVQMEFNNRVDHLIALLGQNRSLGLFSFPNIVNAATVQQESEDPEYEHIINGYINGLSSKL